MHDPKYLGFILAILSMVGLGFSTFLYKRSTDAIGPVNTTFFYYLFSLCIAVVVWLLSYAALVFAAIAIILFSLD